MESFQQQDYKPSSYSVYTGVWRDWTNGRVFGATLTLHRREGALLIAFLALFVSVVGTHFWRISCFVLHHAYSTDTAQDALHHQRQVVLRNSASGTGALASLINILWTWSRKRLARKPIQRTLPLIGYALLCMVAFGVAGTFSSKISTSLGNEVLIRGKNCGILDSEAYTSLPDQITTFYPYMSQLMNSYASYAEQCYSNISDAQSCNAYIKQQLPTKVDRNASCPFGDGICKHEYGNIVLDTGYLDSHFDFGINAPPHERVQFRRVSSCAPIKSDGYTNSSQPAGTDRNNTYYYYGPAIGMGGDVVQTYPFSYVYPDFTWSKTGERIRAFTMTRGFTLGTLDAFAINGTYSPAYSEFQPIPALQIPDADMHLLFLSANGLDYVSPVSDTWYAAHFAGYNISIPSATSAWRLHQQDASVSVLACTVKEQFCNPVSSRCAPFGGTYESAALADNLWTSATHHSIFRRIASVFLAYGLTQTTIPAVLGPSALAAHYKIQGGICGALPPNQWQQEVEHWHAASLVGTQGIMALTANGPSDARLEPWLRKPNNTVEEGLCASQKIKSPTHFNFSLFYLLLTLAVGTALIVLAYVIEPLTRSVQKRRGRGEYARVEWTTNETLQLQRMAHEELGVGHWEGCAEDVPVTGWGERLAVLDLGEVGHPRLRAPGAEVTEVGVVVEGKNDDDSLVREGRREGGEVGGDGSRTALLGGRGERG